MSARVTRRLILVGLPQVHVQHGDQGGYDDQLQHHRIIADFSLDCKSSGIWNVPVSDKRGRRVLECRSERRTLASAESVSRRLFVAVHDIYYLPGS